MHVKINRCFRYLEIRDANKLFYIDVLRNLTFLSLHRLVLIISRYLFLKSSFNFIVKEGFKRNLKKF